MVIFVAGVFAGMVLAVALIAFLFYLAEKGQ